MQYIYEVYIGPYIYIYTCIGSQGDMDATGGHLGERVELLILRHVVVVYTPFLRRRELALKYRELTAEQGLLSLRVQKVETANKEGASAARDEEARNLKEHQVMYLSFMLSAVNFGPVLVLVKTL